EEEGDRPPVRSHFAKGPPDGSAFARRCPGASSTGLRTSSRESGAPDDRGPGDPRDDRRRDLEQEEPGFGEARASKLPERREHGSRQPEVLGQVGEEERERRQDREDHGDGAGEPRRNRRDPIASGSRDVDRKSVV